MKKYILGAVLSIGLLVSPAFTQAAALTTVQATSLIELVKSSPSTPASAFVGVITEFSKITEVQATTLINLVKSSPSTPSSAFVDVITSFTDDTGTSGVAAPTVTSSFSPSTIPSTGSTFYSYSSKNTTHCVATHPDGTGTWDNITPNAWFSAAYNGSQLPIGVSTTTITCYNATGQSVVSTATVTVTAATAVVAPTINSFTASPTSITSGQSTLSWTSTGADSNSCNLDDGTVGLGFKAANSSFAVSPTVTTTYNLLCGKYNPATGFGLYSSVSHVTVTVTAATPDYTSFLTTTYQTELGRAPDSAGLTYWVDKLMTGAATQAQATDSIHNSAEAVQYRFLKNLYLTDLGRAPDTTGLAYWIDKLMTGAATQVQATDSIHASAEAVIYRAGSASALNAFNSATNAGPSQSPGTGNTNTFHYVWNNNLQIGSSYSEDVKALQTALTHEGLYTGEVSGGFYNQTFSAVKAFQQKYGIDTGTTGAGFVGLKTRAKLNTLY